MSLFASVPTSVNDWRSPQTSAEPNVSAIFGHVFVARQRSSRLAGGRLRAASAHGVHHTGPSCPSSYGDWIRDSRTIRFFVSEERTKVPGCCEADAEHERILDRVLQLIKKRRIET